MNQFDVWQLYRLREFHHSISQRMNHTDALMAEYHACRAYLTRAGFEPLVRAICEAEQQRVVRAMFRVPSGEAIEALMEACSKADSKELNRIIRQLKADNPAY